MDLATQAPRNNPGDDVELGEEVTVIRAAAWQLLGDMRQAEQLAGRLAPLDGSSDLALARGVPPGHVGAIRSTPTTTPKRCSIRRWRSAATAQNFIVSMLALGRLALIAADRGDWPGCTARVEAAFDVVRANGLEEYWICSFGPRRTRAAVPSRPATDGGTGRAGASGQPRSARRWPGRVVIRPDDARRAAAASWAIAAQHASWCSKRVSCSRALLSPARSHRDWWSRRNARCDW